MKASKPAYATIYLSIYLLVIGVFLLHLRYGTDLGPFWERQESAETLDFSNGWVTGDRVLVDVDDISAKKFGGSVILTRALPETLRQNDTLCFSSNNARVTVWIDGELVYEFNSVENLTGRGYGTAYHSVNLSPEDAGKPIRIGMVSVFANRGGGRLQGLRICPAMSYQHTLVREELLSGGVSLLIILFGLVIVGLHFGLARRNELPYNLAALGTSTVLIGMWCLVDTGLPQLLTGCVYASRTLDYSLLHLAIYPFVCFVNSLTRQKRAWYIHASFLLSMSCILAILSLRYFAGMDMHVQIPLVYFSYLSPIVLIVVVLVDNGRYCRKNGVPMNLKYFYTGAIFLLLGGLTDIAVYLVSGQSAKGHGGFLRFGLCIFVIALLLQLLHWWSNERVSIERDRIVNRVLQYAMSAEDPDTKLRAVLEYMGTALRADRAYIFEDMHDGTFDNTYEWCREGVSAEIDNLKGLPYEGVVEAWYDEYKKSNRILIYDIEKYRAVSEGMYNVLKPQGIETLVTAPLVVNGEYIGFFGVDNPPAEAMREVSEIIGLLSYCLAQVLLQRDDQNRLIRYSYYDAMTGSKNRRAFKEFETAEGGLDRAYGFVMCDINGLKRANDAQGHEEGNRLIVDVAACLREVFGTENVYRLGGDEFGAYADRDAEADFQRDVERVRSLIAGKGRSAAIGAVFRPAGGPDLARVKAEADTRMYQEKKAYYENGNDRRRGR